MTGHILSDLIVLSVATIVVGWLASAIFGWVYLLWLFLPPLTDRRRIPDQHHGPAPSPAYPRPRDPRLGE